MKLFRKQELLKQQLHNHFKSKEEICLSYLRHKNTNFIDEIDTFTSSKPKGKKQILAIFDFLKLFFRTKDFNGCWCIKTVSEISKDNERIRSEIQNQKTFFIQMITNLVSTNLKNKEEKEIDSLAKQIYLIYESAVTESHLHQIDWPIKEARNLCSKIIE